MRGQQTFRTFSFDNLKLNGTLCTRRLNDRINYRRCRLIVLAIRFSVCLSKSIYFESKMTYERKHNRLSSNDKIFIHIAFECVEKVVAYNTGLLNFDSNVFVFVYVNNIVPQFN